MSTKPRYSYPPLSSPRHTRLVILHSSRTDNYPIDCELVEVSIDDGPVYEALSYTWNNEVPSQPLEIISADGSGPKTLLITTNCARALRLLRKRIGKRPTSNIGLWVDAICINQSCNEEKSAQVSMMAEIYRKAKTVVVWLGHSHAPLNRRAMAPLKLALPYSAYHRMLWSQTWKLRWINKVCSVATPVVKKIIAKGTAHSIPRIESAPYWTRAWTLQEYPHITTRILCLNSAYCSIIGLDPMAGVFHSMSEMLPHFLLLEFNRRGLSGPVSFDIILNLLIFTECSNPRDKVFSLRELVPSVFGGITVDYNRTVEDIFTEATRCLILASQSLRVLYSSCSCRRLYEVLHPHDKAYDIPSWAIDWTGSQYRASDECSLAMSWWDIAHAYYGTIRSGNGLIASFSENGLTLKLSGKHFALVSNCVSGRVIDHPDPNRRVGCLMRTVRSFLKEATETQPISESTLGCVVVKLLRVIRPRVIRPRVMRSHEFDELRRTESQMEVESDVDRICALMRKPEFQFVYSDFISNRRLFVTTDGMIGAGNTDLVPGDLICNFKGLDMPFVVRKKGARCDLVCPAIVIGAMDGEMWPEDENKIVPWEIT